MGVETINAREAMARASQVVVTKEGDEAVGQSSRREVEAEEGGIIDARYFLNA